MANGLMFFGGLAYLAIWGAIGWFDVVPTLSVHVGGLLNLTAIQILGVILWIFPGIPLAIFMFAVMLMGLFD